MRSAGSLPGLETKTENIMFAYAKTPKVCDLIGQIMFAQKSVCLSLPGGASFGQAASSILPSFAWFR